MAEATTLVAMCCPITPRGLHEVWFILGVESAAFRTFQSTATADSGHAGGGGGGVIFAVSFLNHPTSLDGPGGGGESGGGWSVE